MQAQPQNISQGQQTQVTEPQPGKPTGKKTMVIGAVIAIIVVVMLVLVMFLTGVIGGNSQATPEGAVNSLVSAYNNHDAKALLDCTTMHFLSSSNYSLALSSMQTSMNMMKNDNLHVTMTNIVVTSSALMTQSEKQLVSQAESQLTAMGVTVTVQDSCIVSATATTTGTGSSGGSSTSQIVALKINGQWYLSMPTGIDNPPQTTTVFGIVKSSTATKYVFTVTAISGGSPVLKTDVYVLVKNATGSVTISTVQLGTATGTDGFNYTSASSGQYISVGDVFTLDRTLYAVGSTLTLVTASGANQYCIMTI